MTSQIPNMVSSAISNKFVDEYMNFYEKCIGKRFAILLDDVLKQLSIGNKKRFHEKFRKKIELSDDYIIERFKIKGQKYVKSTRYSITLDTFEKICMRTNAKKGSEFRDYLIMLRKIIDCYKQCISDAIPKNNIIRENGTV